MKHFPIFFLLFVTNVVLAQETTGILRGTLIDKQNTAVKNAFIRIHQKSTGFVSTTISQTDGHFTFNQLQPANDYDIEITAVDFSEYKEENIQIQL